MSVANNTSATSPTHLGDPDEIFLSRFAMRPCANYLTFDAHGERWVVASKMPLDTLMEWAEYLKNARSEAQFDALCNIFPGIIDYLQDRGPIKYN